MPNIHETAASDPLSLPVHVGTMGWNYPDWIGVFYPAGTALRDSLSVYARSFGAVEIDSAFYGTPRESLVARWYQMTPPAFVFCPKVPRLITHDMGLQEVEVPLREYLRVISGLKEKRGAILFQMPPSFTRNNLPALEMLLPRLGDLGMGGERFAIEFRHRSLLDREVSELLKAHNVARVSADYVGMPRRFEITANFCYVRLIGKHGQFDQHASIQKERHEDVALWANALRARQSALETAYVFCNNDYEGYSPSTANRFKEALGLPSIEKPPPVQGSLF